MTFTNRTSAGLLALALPLAGCDGVLDPRGPIGASERLILINSVAIMLVIVIPVIVATLGFAWWFRASNDRATYLPYWSFSGQLELIVWAIPALVITFLGGIAWFGSHALDPFRPLESKTAPIEIEVVSLDWKWLFIYPNDGVASVNQIGIPTGVPVHFRLTSSGVMNSFFRAAARQPDLHNGRHDVAAQPASRSAGRLPGPFGAVQRRRLFRHALCRARLAAERLCEMDRQRESRRQSPRRDGVCGARPAIRQCAGRYLSQRRSKAV